MPFPSSIKQEALVRSRRRCCVCHEFAGRNSNVHHMVQEAEGGPNTLDNAIVLCLRCHAEAGHYNPQHPIGNKYSPTELRRHRDLWWEWCETYPDTPILTFPPGTPDEQRYVPFPPPDPDTLPDPGALPPGSHLSFFYRNALFTGRTEPLKALARALLHDQAPSTLVTQAVQGMGGVGKTQLAVEFAYRYGRFFQGVHWLNAARPEALGAEVALCGAAMCLSNWPETQPEQVARTLDEWRRAGPRLVILDNLEDVSAARQWLARLGGEPIRLLLTARRSDWPADLGLNPLPLEVFSPQESRDFLRRYLSEERAGDADLAALAGRLGRLPLALELAGRYLVRFPRLTVAGYLEKLENVWNHPSMQGWREDLGSPTGHDLDLAATFALSWEQVSGQAARRLFWIAGYCAPNQPIPCELLERAAELETEACDEALNVLAGLGLLQMEDVEAGPVIHPLLAEYACHRVGEPDPLPALARAVDEMASEATQSGLPARMLPLLPHLRQVTVAADARGDRRAAWLYNELGYHLRIVADYTGARPYCERALAIREKVLGAEHPDTAESLNNLGALLQTMGDLAGARPYYERALAIFEKVLSADHPNTMVVRRKLDSLDA